MLIMCRILIEISGGVGHIQEVTDQILVTVQSILWMLDHPGFFTVRRQDMN